MYAHLCHATVIERKFYSTLIAIVSRKPFTTSTLCSFKIMTKETQSSRNDPQPQMLQIINIPSLSTTYTRCFQVKAVSFYDLV